MKWAYLVADFVRVKIRDPRPCLTPYVISHGAQMGGLRVFTHLTIVIN